MSEQAVWASMTSAGDVWASMGAGAGADLGTPVVRWQAAGPGERDALDDEELDGVEEDLVDEDLDDEDEDDDADDDDDLDEFEDDELDDDDDDDEADEIDFTEDRYGRIPGEDDADV